MSTTEEIIDRMGDEIKQLKRDIQWHEEIGNWMVHRSVNEEEMDARYPGYKKLPLPRFEMIIAPTKNFRGEEWYSVEWAYGIVYMHYIDGVKFIPLGRTTGNGGHPRLKRGEIEFPYRDGLHIRTEMKVFDLKGYVMCTGKIKEINLIDGYSEDIIEDAYKSMKRI